MNEPSRVVSIAGRKIGLDHPAYFIADIAANHDGDFQRAVELIHLAAEAGADAAKFQHFSAETIVSDVGFKALGRQSSHQAEWKKSVYEVYQDAAIDLEWTVGLKEACEEAGIHFFSSPYSLKFVDYLDPLVPAYKVGSGDITWHEIIADMANRGKPVLISSGASTMDELQAAMEVALKHTGDVILLQCNTNYTGHLSNLAHVNLRVLNTFAAMYPGLVLGLSDHTSGHASVLGAVALGARAIEKHFTDDTTREGPDHHFAMDPAAWSEMVVRTRELELSLGDGRKKVEDNELETVQLQRRAIRTVCDLGEGTHLKRIHLAFLRPCPPDGLPPAAVERIVGRRLSQGLRRGDHVRWECLE